MVKKYVENMVHRITYVCKLNYTEHVVSKNYACIQVYNGTIW